MLFIYKALDQDGKKKDGTIDALNKTSRHLLFKEEGLLSSLKGDEKKSIFKVHF